MTVLSWIVYSVVVSVHLGMNVAVLILGFILFVAMYGIVAIQNDLSDYEADKINGRRDIPYARGVLTESQLIKTMFALSIIATITGLILNASVLIWVAAYIMLGYIYSGPLNIKSRGMLASLLLGICYGALPWIIAGSVTGQLNDMSLLGMAFISFVFSSGIIVLKDFKDIKGDRATNKRTLLVRSGASFVRAYYLILTSVAYVLLACYPYLVNESTLLAVGAIIFGILNYYLLASRAMTTNSSFRSKRGKWARVLFFGLSLAFYVHSFYV